MANEEHVALLKQGVEVWNEWREANPDVQPELSGAELKDAILQYADLSESNLESAYLERSYLEGANLRGANLYHAFLIGANLTDAYLMGANLMGAALLGANLMGASLYGANLTATSLKEANLEMTNLGAVQALDASFWGATLTGACIQDWNINVGTTLSNIICDYVYLSVGGGRGHWSERRPHTGTFAPGEFTKLFQEAQDTIDLIFREGLDWKAFAYSFKQTEVQHEDAHLSIRDIGNRDDGVVIVKVATTPDTDKALIHSEFMKGYELAAKAIAAQYEARLVDKDQHINQLFTLLQSSQERLGEVPKLMADMKPGDTNYYGDIKATNFAHGGIASGGTFNDFSNTLDLVQAASQIQALLAQLQQQGHSPEDAQQQVANDLAEQAKQDPTTLGRLMMWGQKLGDATVTDVVKGVVKMALRAAGVPLP